LEHTEETEMDKVDSSTVPDPTEWGYYVQVNRNHSFGPFDTKSKAYAWAENHRKNRRGTKCAVRHAFEFPAT
jgi:hypothetical protein